ALPDGAREEPLLREAMGLFEQKRYSEALLACEGALVLNPQSIAALALKGAIHERLGQVSEAIRAYERVLELNPLSVSERVRLEALRGQVQRAGKATYPPLWKETLPVVLAFMGTSVVLIVGLVMVLRLSTPSAPPQSPSPQVATEPAPTVPPPNLRRPAEESTDAPATPTPPSNGAVPPVVIDPSRVALAPSSPPDTTLRGAIPPLPSAPPERETREQSSTESRPPRETTPPSPEPSRSEVMPDVQVRETEQRGVYEIRVYTAGSGNSAERPQRSANTNTALTQAQNYQMAGNFREALNAYRQALAQAEFKGAILQQMAICYFRLGDLANARQHFQQAIAEYERQIQQGRDVESARQGIVACQNGLRLCEE
ncbi:MAG: tetratricopeptide repeat protein, partial [Fimbriimonadales bacterium]